MEPGREMDALVAEKVMGWIFPPHTSVLGQMWVEPPMGYVHPEGPPHYSTDIAAAWRVVEHTEEHYAFSLRTVRDESEFRYTVEITPLHSARHIVPNVKHRVYGLTAPHAICLAALRACNIEV